MKEVQFFEEGESTTPKRRDFLDVAPRKKGSFLVRRGLVSNEQEALQIMLGTIVVCIVVVVAVYVYNTYSPSILLQPKPSKVIIPAGPPAR